MNVNLLLKSYKMKKLTVATLGSHSALDVCSGAKQFGFKTLVVAQKGRDKTYSSYYQTNGKMGCVDQCLIVDSFADLFKSDLQKKLVSRNCVFIPNRSFEVYLNFDYSSIEKKFDVPMFGNRYLLKIEERSTKPNQYDLLEKAIIRYPKQFENPKEIDRLCLVKVLEKERGYERAFFLVENYSDFKNQAREKLKQGIFTDEQLNSSVIEEFIIGTPVILTFFIRRCTNDWSF